MKITPKKYAQALADVLETSPDVGATMQNFLGMLRRHKQFRLLHKIVLAFEKEWSARNGIVTMHVTYPKAFESEVAAFEISMTQALGKKIRMKKSSSDTMIGGYRVNIDDTLLDASLETQLNSIANNFNH